MDTPGIALLAGAGIAGALLLSKLNLGSTASNTAQPSTSPGFSTNDLMTAYLLSQAANENAKISAENTQATERLYAAAKQMDTSNLQTVSTIQTAIDKGNADFKKNADTYAAQVAPNEMSLQKAYDLGISKSREDAAWGKYSILDLSGAVGGGIAGAATSVGTGAGVFLGSAAAAGSIGTGWALQQTLGTGPGGTTTKSGQSISWLENLLWGGPSPIHGLLA